MILHNERYRSLILSILLHILLIVVLTVFLIHPVIVPHWYEFDFRLQDEANTVIKPRIDTQINSKKRGTPVPAKNNSAPASTKTTTIKKSDNALASDQPAKKNEIIQPPSVSEVTQPANQYSKPENPALKGLLKSLTNQNASPGGSVNYSIEGGNVRITPPANFKHNLGEPGWSVLNFQLDTNGQLITSSIKAVGQSGPGYYDTAVSVLKKSSFRFNGKPETGQIYKIRIVFN
jgi:hypothetical protein